ncbi:MAG: MATE family efflux transporter [Spirochaetales bacterium]|nr:MATE family efflux transporter [Spirochaetales bacterium]
MNNPLRRAPLLTELIKLSLPIMASNLLQTMYNMVDAYFLGKLGKEAISAPSIVFNISNFIIVFGVAFSVAGTTMLSQSYGNNPDNKERLDFLASQVFVVNTFMSLVVLVLGLVLAHPLLTLMRVPSGLTYHYTYQYMTITYLAMPLLFGDLILRGILQGVGDSLTPLFIQLGAVVLNIILDPIFIFVLKLEVAGAAWATLLARLVSCSISFYILFKGSKGVKVRPSLFKPHKPTLTLMAKIGLPAALGQSLSSLGFAVIQGVINFFGPAVIAAVGVGNRVQSIFNMPGQGISQGVAIMVGKKLGEEEPKEAEEVVRIGLWLIGIFIAIGMTLVLIYGRYIIIFFVNDPEVIAYGLEMFRFTTISVFFFSLYTVALGAFQGGGRTRSIMTLNLVRLWGLRVPLSYLLPLVFNMGTNGIWIGMLASNVLTTIWAFILYKRGSWKVTLDLDVHLQKKLVK